MARARARTTRPPQIHKFGGASLADAAAIGHAVGIVQAQRPEPLVVVVSAMSGVTDALLDGAARAARGDASHVRAADEPLRAQHVAAAQQLVPAGARLEELLGLIDAAFAELEQVAGGLGVLRELTPRTTDYLAARGERLSARLFAAALDAAGCRAAYVDAAEIVQTDGTFGNASPDLRRTERSARTVLRPLLARGVVPVVPGFLGAAPDGQVATLGRGGSDLTATLLARVLGAREVSLWKDVPGLLTADPRIVPDARVVPQLHVREGAERARKSLEEPFRPEIGRQEIDGVEVRTGLATLVVVGLGMAGTPGIAARVFSALAEARINVIATAQGSSELNLSLVVDAKDAPRAQRAVHAAFQLSKIGGGAVAHPDRTDVVLLGFGQIGRTLAPMIAKVKQDAVTLRIVGLIDRSGLVFDAPGLSPRRLTALAAAKAKGTPLAKAAGGRRAGAAEAGGGGGRGAAPTPRLAGPPAAHHTDPHQSGPGGGG